MQRMYSTTCAASVIVIYSNCSLLLLPMSPYHYFYLLSTLIIFVMLLSADLLHQLCNPKESRPAGSIQNNSLISHETAGLHNNTSLHMHSLRINTGDSFFCVPQQSRNWYFRLLCHSRFHLRFVSFLNSVVFLACSLSPACAWSNCYKLPFV